MKELDITLAGIVKPISQSLIAFCERVFGRGSLVLYMVVCRVDEGTCEDAEKR